MNFLIDNWQTIAATLGTIITGFVGFLSGRKSKKISEQDQQASALQNMQLAYDKFTEQTNKQIDRVISELDDVKGENKEQRKAVMALQKDNSKLHLEVSKLMTENKKLKQMIAELKYENEVLRKIN